MSVEDLAEEMRLVRQILPANGDAADLLESFSRMEILGYVATYGRTMWQVRFVKETRDAIITIDIEGIL